MKRFSFIFTLTCLSAMVFLTACNGKYPGYKQAPDGLYYRFYQQDLSAAQPKQTDFLRLDIACYLHDSLYYDWNESGSDVYLQLSEPHFKGDLQSALAMMRLGDSASFYIKADSVAIHYYDQNPDSVGLKADDNFRYEVKLLEIKSQEQFQMDIERAKKEKMDEAKALFDDYIKKEGVTVEPYGSGIYVVTTEKGKGRCPVKGEKVELDFEAFLLNGQQIGSTFSSDEKFTFVLGEGYVIPGWEEIVPKMHLGERVRAYIPFEMAYGEHSVPGIPMYANLVYDIKLLKITTAEELQRQAALEIKKMKADSEQALISYLKENNITEHTPSGLYYVKSALTQGQSPEAGMTARIAFEASYLDGTPLGSSEQLGGHYDVPFGQGSVLRGLEEGVGLMHVGEQARFVLPYYLAYGERPYGNIPAFSNLIFDVTLLDVLPTENQTVENK
jgi:FKBP-type peptidyl-prolyl cis-trans isomerase